MRPLRPADPDLRHADDRRPAGVVLAVVVGALLAAAMLAGEHEGIRDALDAYRAAQTQRVLDHPDPSEPL